MKMSDLDLKSIVQSEVVQAASYQDTWQSRDREEAMRYYLGEPFGDEQEGRSSVVSRDVSDTVEWILPSLLRIFASGDKVVEYAPTGPEDEAVSEQATDYANWIMDENGSFLLQYNWIKDALLMRNGIIKITWEKETEVCTDEREGLSDDELLLYVQGLPEGYKVVSHSEEMMDLPEVDPATGAPFQMRLHSIKVKWEETEGELCVEGVPPEEFLISKRAKSLDDAGFVGHRVILTRSELVEQGFDPDIVANIPTYSSVDYAPEKLSRFNEDAMTPDHQDESMQEVCVVEAYIKVDYDGDGIAEWRKVLIGGDDASGEILENEEWTLDCVPFASLSPILMPHTFFGRSVADLVMDIQRIKSVLLRQMLDGLYLSTNPRTEVVDGQVNLDDLLTSRPGGLVRVKAPGMMREIATTWPGQQAFPMLNYIDQVRQERSGASAQGMGPDSNALQNVSATAFNGQLDMARQRVELIARIFAETGYKRLFKLILKFITKYQDKAKVIKLRNEWVPIDPRGWNAEMDVRVNVGLGTGNKDAMLGHLMAVAGKQEQIIQLAGPDNPLCGLPEYHNTLKQMITNAGLGDPQQFFKDPSEAAMNPQPPKPDPKMMELQQQAELEVAKMQQDAQIEVAKMQQQAELNAVKLDAEMQGKRAQMEAEIQLKREQMAAEMQLKREQMMIEAQMQHSVNMSASMGGMTPVQMGGELG
jgi:hypothetical protein